MRKFFIIVLVILSTSCSSIFEDKIPMYFSTKEINTLKWIFGDTIEFDRIYWGVDLQVFGTDVGGYYDNLTDEVIIDLNDYSGEIKMMAVIHELIHRYQYKHNKLVDKEYYAYRYQIVYSLEDTAYDIIINIDGEEITVENFLREMHEYLN